MIGLGQQPAQSQRQMSRRICEVSRSSVSLAKGIIDGMSSVVTFLLNLLPLSTSPFYNWLAETTPSYYRPAIFNDSFKFPKDFLHGYATAATQIEGGITTDGRGLSIWDPFSHHKGSVKDASTTDVTCGSYEVGIPLSKQTCH